MNGTVWKFPIPFGADVLLDMPRDAELLFVAAQYDVPCLWARVVPERAKEERRFRLRGTGHPVDLDCKHVGSFLMQGDMLVFHLFEVVR